MCKAFTPQNCQSAVKRPHLFEVPLNRGRSAVSQKLVTKVKCRYTEQQHDCASTKEIAYMSVNLRALFRLKLCVRPRSLST